MVKPSLKYTILCGLFLIILFWVSVKFGSNPLLDIRHFLFDLVLFFLFIYFAAREYKYYHNDGFLHFWQGMSIAFIVYFPAAILFSIGMLVVLSVDPTIMEEYRQGGIAFLESQKDVLLEGISQEEYNERLDEVNKIGIGELVVSSGLKKILAGFFITPVVSIILRKKPK